MAGSESAYLYRSSSVELCITLSFLIDSVICDSLELSAEINLTTDSFWTASSLSSYCFTSSFCVAGSSEHLKSEPLGIGSISTSIPIESYTS